ncbi:MAG: OmpA family protein [Maritimibacter sp.]
MHLIKKFSTPLVFFGAALLALLMAWVSVGVIERVSKSAVDRVLMLEGLDWAQVEADGLQVVMTGTAPDEPTRFKAMSAASGEVESSRIIDHMDVPRPEAVVAPTFSIEILRNGAGISMIGLIPAATDREALAKRIQRIVIDKSVTDLLESADYPVPEGWDAALDYALEALDRLPRSKISMNAERVQVEAISDSEEQKREIEDRLARAAPGGIRVALDISAPRPVITPFTLRFTIDEAGARFDACTAGTEMGRTKIVAAGIASGVKGRPDCTIGLGMPSPDWPEAVSMAVTTLKEMGAGSVTFSDADVTLVADSSVNQRNFDRAAGELEADLPDVFSLHATKAPAENAADQGPPEFVATLSQEGKVQLRGKLMNAQERTIAESMARARFGVSNVYSATRLDETLPSGWSVRVLAAVEALSHLDNGTATVQPDKVVLNGVTGNTRANAEISRILSEKLGEAEDFRVNVTYDEALDPTAALPEPEECVAMINAALNKSKITFAPGSVAIEASAASTIDAIAEILKSCPDVPMEIGGHTDSQGSEGLNKSLSQQRANSVLNTLLARRILTGNLTAHGYGEEQPIADNETEAGREANRRIEFRLVGQADLPEAAPEVTADEASDAQDTDAEDEGTNDEAAATEGGESEAPSIRPAPRPDDLDIPEDAQETPQTETPETQVAEPEQPDAPVSADTPESAAEPQDADATSPSPDTLRDTEDSPSEPTSVPETTPSQAERSELLSDAPEGPPENAAPQSTGTENTGIESTGTDIASPENAAAENTDTVTPASTEAPAQEPAPDSPQTEIAAPNEDASPSDPLINTDTTDTTDTNDGLDTPNSSEAAALPLGDPIVVNPEVEGIHPKPRPAR